MTMILKYALFTLTVSVLPLTIILKDANITSQTINFISSKVPLVSFHSIHSILNMGLVTTLFSSCSRPTTSDASSNAEVELDEAQKDDEIIFSKDLLQNINGKDGKLYLAILGNVFDVSKATKFYGVGETYHGFTGRDGSRAFVTGDFTDRGFIDDVLDLKREDIQSLNDWLKFFHKDYTYKGKLVGRYFDENGTPTEYHHKLQNRLADAIKEEREKNVYKFMYPPCNVEWTPEEGSRVWCSERSGGIERDWVGVPRKIYEPGAPSYRCACINMFGESQITDPEDGKTRIKNLEEYKDCDPKATSCYVGKSN